MTRHERFTKAGKAFLKSAMSHGDWPPKPADFTSELVWVLVCAECGHFGEGARKLALPVLSEIRWDWQDCSIEELERAFWRLRSGSDNWEIE